MPLSIVSGRSQLNNLGCQLFFKTLCKLAINRLCETRNYTYPDLKFDNGQSFRQICKCSSRLYDHFNRVFVGAKSLGKDVLLRSTSS